MSIFSLLGLFSEKASATSFSLVVWKMSPGGKAESAVGAGQGAQCWEKPQCWCLRSGLKEQAHLACVPAGDKSLRFLWEGEWV